MKNMMLAVVLAVMSASATAGKSSWSVNPNLDGNAGAMAQWDNFAIQIVFVASMGCHKAVFAVYGVEGIEHMSLRVDGELFRGGEADLQGYSSVDSSPFSGLLISKGALKAIKAGNRATLHTNVGRLDIRLEGSAKALNKAWALCEASNGNFKYL